MFILCLVYSQVRSIRLYLYILNFIIYMYYYVLFIYILLLKVLCKIIKNL